MGFLIGIFEWLGETFIGVWIRRKLSKEADSVAREQAELAAKPKPAADEIINNL